MINSFGEGFRSVLLLGDSVDDVDAVDVSQ